MKPSERINSIINDIVFREKKPDESGFVLHMIGEFDTRAIIQYLDEQHETIVAMQNDIISLQNPEKVCKNCKNLTMQNGRKICILPEHFLGDMEDEGEIVIISNEFGCNQWKPQEEK